MNRRRTKHETLHAVTSDKSNVLEDEQYASNYDEPAYSYSEDFDEKVQVAQQQLQALQQQQQEIERKKAELEELSRKQGDFTHRRADLLEELSKSITFLDTEMRNAQLRVDEFAQTRQIFEQHQQMMGALNPDSWARENLKAELSRGLEAVHDAEADFAAGLERMEAVGGIAEGVKPIKPAKSKPGNFGGNLDGDFIHWLKTGFAFSLPLIIFGVIGLLVIMAIFGGK